MQTATLDQINAALQLEIDDALEHSLPREVALHPFERAKLGTAPFACVDCTIGEHRCAFCTTSLKYLYHIQDAHGRRFVVGSECVKQTGGAVAGFEKFNRQMEARVRKMQADARKQREAAKAADKAAAWKEAYPAEWEYIQLRAGKGSSFYSYLKDAVDRYGGLFESRLSGIRRDMAEDTRRAQAAAAPKPAPAPVVNLEPVQSAFAKAKEAGIVWPRLRLDSFVFTPASANSNNAGAVYIKEDGVYLGKVMNGRLFKDNRACTAETESRILAVAADPKSAAIAFGKKFGKCSACGRDLTDAVSVANGIGPICAERFGF